MRKKALITNGTNCIGVSFAMKVASLGLDIILIGSDIEKLKTVKSNIIERYSIAVELIVADLTDYNDINKVVNIIKDIRSIEIVINCTGHSVPGGEKYINYKKQLEIVHATITAYSRLTKVILPRMIENDRGTIIFVSSQISSIPFSRSSIYSESKDFVNVFTQLIYNRLKGTNVHVQSLNLSGIHKAVYYNKKSGLFPQCIFNANIAEAVDYSFENLGKSLIVIPGWKNKLLMHFKKIVSNVTL